MITSTANPLQVKSLAFQHAAVASAMTALVVLVVSLSARGATTAGNLALGSVAIGTASLLAAATAARSTERKARSSILFGVLYPAYFGISFGWTSLTWINPMPSNARTTQDHILALFPLILLTLFGWWIGYKLASTRPAEKAAQRFGLLYANRASAEWTTSRVLAIYAIATFARLFLLLSGSYGYLADIDRVISTGSVTTQIATGVAAFAPVALLLLAVDCFRRVTVGRVLALLFATTLEIVFTALSAQKNPFLLMGLSLLLAGVAVGRISWKWVGVGALVGILAIFPFTGVYRSLLRPTPGYQAPTSEAGELFVTAIADTGAQFSDPVRYVQDSLEAAAGRLRSIDDLAVAVDTHTRRPYNPPSELLERAATLAVPRILWPSKPVDLYALEVSRDYFGTPDIVITASTLSVIGDGYRYGGPPMAFVVLLYMGMLCRFLDVAFDHRRSPTLLVPIVAVIPILHEGDVVGLTVRLVLTLLFLLPALWFLSRRDRRIVAKT